MNRTRYILGFLLVSSLAPLAQAAELRIVASVAIRAAFDKIVPEFEKETGQAIAIQWGTGAAVKQRIDAGDAFDVAITVPPVIDSLIETGVLLPDLRLVVGVTIASLAYRDGTPRPEISTPGALKAALLGATTISLSDPALGGASSSYFMAVIKELGISEEVKPKLLFTKPGEGAAPVGAGVAQYGAAQTSEIAAVPGVSGVPIFPADPRSTTTLVACVGANSDRKEAARAFIDFLQSPESLAVLKAMGFEPR